MNSAGSKNRHVNKGLIMFFSGAPIHPPCLRAQQIIDRTLHVALTVRWNDPRTPGAHHSLCNDSSNCNRFGDLTDFIFNYDASLFHFLIQTSHV